MRNDFEVSVLYGHAAVTARFFFFFGRRGSRDRARLSSRNLHEERMLRRRFRAVTFYLTYSCARNVG